MLGGFSSTLVLWSPFVTFPKGTNSNGFVSSWSLCLNPWCSRKKLRSAGIICRKQGVIRLVRCLYLQRYVSYRLNYYYYYYYYYFLRWHLFSSICKLLCQIAFESILLWTLLFYVSHNHKSVFYHTNFGCKRTACWTCLTTQAHI